MSYNNDDTKLYKMIRLTKLQDGKTKRDAKRYGTIRNKVIQKIKNYKIQKATT